MIWILIYEMPGLFELVHTSRGWIITAVHQPEWLQRNRSDWTTAYTLAVFTECKFCQKKTDPGKSHTFSAALVMTYEVWQLAANCSSFYLSHRSNLMLGAKLLRHETSMWYKSSLVRRQMRKTNEGNQTRKKEKNRLSVTAWKPVPSSFFLFMLPKAERAVSVSADRIQQEPQGQDMSSLPRVSQHPQSVMTRSHTHAHTANAHSYNTETCTRAEHTSYLICFL